MQHERPLEEKITHGDLGQDSFAPTENWKNHMSNSQIPRPKNMNKSKTTTCFGDI